MDQADIPALLGRLTSDEDAARKMAVFKLQSSINDPAFADVFMSSGGLVVLRRLIMTAGGNTLAYALQSLTRLLEVDMGWGIFEGPGAGDLVERVVELIVANPLVNILRGAMAILVALVGHSEPPPRSPGSFGFRALKPAVAVYPQFFEHVIHQLQSADHALCANALMLINALIRDAVSTDSSWPVGTTKPTAPGEEWSKFIKRLQDLGLIKAVHDLMQSSALQDLANPLLEFQNLTKILLKKWRDVKVDVERPEHRRALKGLHLASNPDRRHANGADEAENGRRKSVRHDPEKWRRLGFETEAPALEFEAAGFLGMMDLTDYVRKNEDGFRKLLLEQSARPLGERFPVARASLAVTVMLCDMFEVDKMDLDDARGLYHPPLDGSAKADDRLFRPMLLQWSRLHTGGLQAFFRLWKATGAARDDFDKVAELVRVLVEHVVGQAGRTRDVAEVEDELREYDCGRLRELQMALLDLAFETQWGVHLDQVREDLKHEALQFVKEQRVRCLLQGSWFPKPVPRPAQSSNQGRPDGQTATNGEAREAREARAGPERRTARPWRFAKLSYNRRHLHYADFDEQLAHDPGLDALTEKVDLSTISSVVSNVSAPADDAQSVSSASTPHNAAARSTTKITIYSFATASQMPTSPVDGATKGAAVVGAGEDPSPKEQPLLTLHPPTHSLASEWLDGLLMLLNQAPITSETSKLVGLVAEYGLRIRLLNVRHDTVYQGPPPDAGLVPSREGLDEEYYYEV